MKKIILVCSILALFQGKSFGQDTVYIVKETIREIVKEKRVRDRPGKDVIPDKQNQIYFGAGWVPYFNSYNSGGSSDYFGSYSLGYTRHINERFSTGFKFAYLRASNRYFYYTDIDGNVNEDRRNFLLFTGHFNLNYYNKKNITLYLGTELGMMTILDDDSYYDYDTGLYVNSKRTRITPVADFTAFGIRMRDKPVSPYFEVGLGLSGFFRGGVNFRF